MFKAEPWGILAIVAVALCWALAVLLFRVSAAGSVARKLSLLLVIEGLTLGSSGAPTFLLAAPETFFAAWPWYQTISGFVHVFGDCAMLALYPLFLAAALNTRLTRPFSQRSIRTGLVACAVLLFLSVMFSPYQTISISLLFVGLVLVFTFALLVSVQAWTTASGATRSRALIFMLAFGFRDLCWGYNYGYAIWEIWTERQPLAAGIDLGYKLYILGTLVSVPLIAYGILRTQLFDIDLRIRWAIKQSTMAGIFFAVMFFISEGVSTVLSTELGTLAGLLAAAVVMFFLAPLQRFAERVASAAMPNTNNTPEYAVFRKLQVYESALIEAQSENGISERERTLLVRLRDSLGISPADAEAIEHSLQTARDRASA